MDAMYEGHPGLSLFSNGSVEKVISGVRVTTGFQGWGLWSADTA